MNITPDRMITKTVHVPAHDVQVLDEDAYWNLDYQGEPAPAGDTLMCLYAKVAYPTIAAAQRQHRQAQAFREAERAQAERASRASRAADREARKAAGKAYVEAVEAKRSQHH